MNNQDQNNSKANQFTELEDKICQLRNLIEAAQREFNTKHKAAHKLYLDTYWPWIHATDAFSKDFQAKNQALYDKVNKSADEISKVAEASAKRQEDFEKQLDQLLGRDKDLHLSAYGDSGKRFSQYLKELMHTTVFNWKEWLRQCADKEQKDYYDLLRKAQSRDPQLKKLFKTKDQAYSKYVRERKRLEKEYAQKIQKAETQLGVKRSIKTCFEFNV